MSREEEESGDFNYSLNAQINMRESPKAVWETKAENLGHETNSYGNFIENKFTENGGKVYSQK